MRYKKLFSGLALAASLYITPPVFANDAAGNIEEQKAAEKAFNIAGNFERARYGEIEFKDAFSSDFQTPEQPKDVFQYTTRDGRTVKAKVEGRSFDKVCSTYTEKIKSPPNDIKAATKDIQYKVYGFLKNVLEKDPNAFAKQGIILTEIRHNKGSHIIENLDDLWILYNKDTGCWQKAFEKYREETPDDRESSEGFNDYLNGIVGKNRFLISLKRLKEHRDKLRKDDYEPFTKTVSGEEFDSLLKAAKQGLNDEALDYFYKVLAEISCNIGGKNMKNIEENIDEHRVQIRRAEQSYKNAEHNMSVHQNKLNELDEATDRSKESDKWDWIPFTEDQSEVRKGLDEYKARVRAAKEDERIRRIKAENDLKGNGDKKEAKEKELAEAKKRLAEERQKKVDSEKRLAENGAVSNLEYFLDLLRNPRRAGKAEAVLEARFYNPISSRVLEIYKLVFDNGESIKIPYVQSLDQEMADILDADPELLDYIGLWIQEFDDPQPEAKKRLEILINGVKKLAGSGLPSYQLREIIEELLNPHGKPDYTIRPILDESGYLEEKNRISSTRNNKKNVSGDTIKSSIELLGNVLENATNEFIKREPNEKVRGELKKKFLPEKVEKENLKVGQNGPMKLFIYPGTDKREKIVWTANGSIGLVGTRKTHPEETTKYRWNWNNVLRINWRNEQASFYLSEL